MPWNAKNYPNSMKNLTAEVRRKAITIANSLLAENYDEGRAIAIALHRAERWALDRGKPIRKKRAPSPSP